MFRYFGPLVLAHRARAEAEHPAARVGQREHDPRAEAVVGAAVLLGALGEARVVELLLAEAAPPRGEQHAVPRARGVADAELAQDLLAEAPALQVLARVGGLLRLPQAALVVGGGAAEQLEQALAAPAALGLAGVLLLPLSSTL